METKKSELYGGPYKALTIGDAEQIDKENAYNFWGISDDELQKLYKDYVKADKTNDIRTKERIEYKLIDCNFHTEWEQFKNGTFKSTNESIKLNEGAGAGYAIKSKGYELDGTVKEFTISATDAKSTEDARFAFDCVVDLIGTVETFSAEAYDSGTGEQHNLPIKCTSVLIEDIHYSELVYYDVVNEGGAVNPDTVNKTALKSMICNILGDCENEFVYGGGWSHSTYDGTIAKKDEYLDSYDFPIKATIVLTNEEQIKAVDRMTKGYGYETQYEVVKDDDVIETFEDKEEAKEYAEENNADEVREVYTSMDFEGNIDVEFGKVVWGNVFVDESLENNETKEENHKCGWCDEEFPESDLRKEKDLGWLCVRCSAAIKSRGERLTFVEHTELQPINDSGKEFKVVSDELSEAGKMIFASIQSHLDLAGLSDKEALAYTLKFLDNVNLNNEEKWEIIANVNNNSATKSVDSFPKFGRD